MAFHGLSRSDTVEYVSPNDPDKANPTRFKLRFLDPFIIGEISDTMAKFRVSEDEMGNINETRSIEMQPAISKRNIQLVRFGLAEVANLLDDSDEPIELKLMSKKHNGRQYEVVPDSFIEKLSAPLLAELATEIWRVNRVDEDDVKN